MKRVMRLETKNFEERFERYFIEDRPLKIIGGNHSDSSFPSPAKKEKVKEGGGSSSHPPKS
jgi:hypothetical protein